jgi:hypothetical protein
MKGHPNPAIGNICAFRRAPVAQTKACPGVARNHSGSAVAWLALETCSATRQGRW